MVFVGRPGSRFVIAGRQWRGIMLLGLGGVFWALVVAQVFVFVPRTASLYDLSFGFGPYVREMITTGQYADCTNAVCDHAARLPLLVWIAAALGTISPNQQLASVMKDLAFAAASLGLLAWLWRKLPQSPSRFWVWLVVAVVMVIGIPASKHASQLNYEEGLGIPLLFMLGLTGPLAISGAVQEGFSRRLMGLSLGLACLLYLLKASLLIVFGVTALATAAWAVRRRCAHLLVLALLAALLPLAWGTYVKAQSGRFSVMTSYDGENLRRGWNAETARIYPVIEIDRVFDSRVAYLPGGELVPIEAKPLRANFANEWAWSDYNRAAAMTWIKAHPGDAAGLELRKVQNYFLSWHETPASYGADGRVAALGQRLKNWLVMIWLLSARAVVYAFVAGCGWLWLRAPDKRPAIGFAAFLAAGYAAPCLMGFNFERHITAGLALTLGSVLALGPDIVQNWMDRTRARGYR